MTEFKSLPVEWKADTATGTVEAIVSVFNNVDHGGDRVQAGAFDATLKAWEDSGDPIPFIWAHDWNNPDAHIGVVTEAKQTDEGLYVKAQVDTERPFASQVLHLLKSRRIKEFSFGYAVKEYGMTEVDGKPVRDLKALDLYEVGPCLLGMNDATRLISAASRAVDDAKAGRVLSSKNEGALREARDLLDAVLQSMPEATDTAKADDEADTKTTEQAEDAGSRDNSTTIINERVLGLLARTRHREDTK